MPTSFDRRPLPIGIAVALALVPGMAAAQSGPVSADPEFVTPRFGHATVPGVNAPDVDVKNTVRWGLIAQYERNPVTGYRLDEEVGQIVSNRIIGHLGVSWDFAEWGTARVVMPLGGNWGSTLPEFAADGFGLGDLGLGATFLPYKSRNFNLGLKADVWFPTSRAEAYIGEQSVRALAGLNMQGKVKFGDWVGLDIVGDASVLGRPVNITNQDFDDGPEMILSESLRISLAWLPVELAFTQALVGRSRFTNFFGPGAESGVEIYGGIQLPFRDIGYNTNMVLDVMAGRGATEGYGTTDLRVLAGLTFSRNPGKKPRPEVVDIVRPPPVIPPPPEEPPADPPIVERLEDEIAIREPVEFYVDTANIKPESLGLLQMVADVINGDARIKHLVIEGHASEEGDFEYNYDLSKARAESIFKQLVLNGVSPARMSTRAYGEVKPRVEGTGEEAWTQNRRVEFHIVSQLPRETLEWPDYGDTVILPWSGETSKVVQPKSPDEIELEELREKYDQIEAQRKRDEFEPDRDEGFDFEGGEGEAPATDEAPADGAEATPTDAVPADEAPPADEATPAEEEAPAEEPPAEEDEAEFEGESFDAPEDEGFEIEGGEVP